MLPKSFPAVLIVAGLVAGCTVGPTYHRPEMTMPEKFQGQHAIDQRHAIASAEFRTWWEGFGDPQMTRYVMLALEQNLDLSQAMARVHESRAGLGAATAALLPAGALNSQATRFYQSAETQPAKTLSSAPGFARGGSIYEYNFSAGWELDFFGGLRREREAMHADYQASEAGAYATQLAVAAQTADIYISIRGLQSRLKIARQHLETQQKLHATILRLYEKGLAAEMQVQQAEGALAQAHASVPILEAGLETAMNAMDVMLGAQPGTHRAEFDNIHPIPAAPTITGMGTPRDLLRRRPDLLVAERRLAAANARIGSAMAEYYPKLSLSGLIGSAASASPGDLLTSNAGQAAGVLGLRWRLFDFGRVDAQIQLAKGQEAEVLAAYRLAVLRATEDVENAFSALVKREEQASHLHQGVNSFSSAREAALKAYQKGVVSLIEVLHADENLQQASDAQVQAQTETAHAAVAAFKALGGGWQATLKRSMPVSKRRIAMQFPRNPSETINRSNAVRANPASDASPI